MRTGLQSLLPGTSFFLKGECFGPKAVVGSSGLRSTRLKKGPNVLRASPGDRFNAVFSDFLARRAAARATNSTRKNVTPTLFDMAIPTHYRMHDFKHF
jgi:hypothetical protein